MNPRAARLALCSLLVPLVPLFLAGRAQARLPGDVVPDRYAIALSPSLSDETRDKSAPPFTGSETIELRVLRATSRIVLNAVDLAVSDVDVTAAGITQRARVTYDGKAETATLEFEKQLSPGPAKLSLKFAGHLDMHLRGLYRARSQNRNFVLTQFEDTDARRAFPCFDEPAYKARFAMTLTVPTGMPAISNTPPLTRTHEKNSALDVVTFAESLPMSSYLVAVAIGPFSSRSTILPRAKNAGGGLPITVWAATGKEGLATYALQAAKDVVPLLESYFGVPYPYGKLDLIAAPEFQYGGMENVAAITFKESALLLDDKVASPASRRRVTEVVAHEIAHQWFGDLVTMQWWDDVWLNESFATWMEKTTIAKTNPAWNIWRDFSVERSDSLQVDELADTHPIRPPATGENDFFDTSPTIIYGKGSAVLRMIERYLGEADFQKGVARYIHAHQFGNTRADDLWKALQEASGKPVVAMAQAWITQAGHPLVSLTTSCEGGHTHVLVEQERFEASGRKSETRWPVPVCFRYGAADASSPASKPTERCVLLEERKQSITLDGECANWVYGNAGASGFYRVRYDARNLAALYKVAPHSLTAPERVALTDDELALAATGLAPLGDFLYLVRSLRGERDVAVLDEIRRAFDLFDRHLVADADRDAFGGLVDEVFGPPYIALSFEVRPGEDEETRALRAQSIEALGLLARRSDVVETAIARFKRFLASPASPASALDASLVNAVAAVAARNGDADLYAQIENRFVVAATPEERERSLDALGRFEEPALISRTLALSLRKDLLTEEIDRPIRAELASRAGRQDAMQFLSAHIDALSDRESPYGRIRLINATNSLCGSDEAKQVRALFAAHPIPRGKLAVALAAETIELCGALRDRGRSDLAAWLRARPSAPSHRR